MVKPKRDYIVIGLSSQIGGGKDYIADILVKNYGFYKVSPGEITREMLKHASHGAIMTREVQEALTKKLIAKRGPDYIMQLCYKKIVSSKKHRIVIPGIRYPNDVAFYRDKFDGSFVNIFISASKATRYKRLCSRTERKDDMPVSYAEFERQDLAQENRYKLSRTKEVSDYKLNNNENDSSALKHRLENILGSLI